MGLNHCKKSCWNCTWMLLLAPISQFVFAGWRLAQIAMARSMHRRMSGRDDVVSVSTLGHYIFIPLVSVLGSFSVGIPFLLSESPAPQLVGAGLLVAIISVTLSGFVFARMVEEHAAGLSPFVYDRELSPTVGIAHIATALDELDARAQQCKMPEVAKSAIQSAEIHLKSVKASDSSVVNIGTVPHPPDFKKSDVASCASILASVAAFAAFIASTMALSLLLIASYISSICAVASLLVKCYRIEFFTLSLSLRARRQVLLERQRVVPQAPQRNWCSSAIAWLRSLR